VNTSTLPHLAQLLMVLEAHVHQLIAFPWLLECCLRLEGKLQWINPQPETRLN
jgi:hypothetical protein